MLSSYLSEERAFTIPPKLRLAYTDFELIQQTSSYRVFEAKPQNSDKIHTIRVLDPTTEFVSNNYGLAATLFIQELLRFQSEQPGAVFINTFEIDNDGRHIAYASLPYYPLNIQSDQRKLMLKPVNPDLIENLISNITSDVEFLWKDIHFRDIMNSLGSESIYFLKDRRTFFLGNWAKYCEVELSQRMDSSMVSSTIFDIKKALTSQMLYNEVKEIAFTALSLKEINCSDLRVGMQNPKIYNYVVKALLEDFSKESQQLSQLIERMFSLDPQNLPTLEELKISQTKNKKEVDEIKPNAVGNLEESKLSKGQAHNDIQVQNPIKIIGKSIFILIIILC